MPEYITGPCKQTANRRGPDPLVQWLLGAAFCALIGPPRPHGHDSITIINRSASLPQTIIVIHHSYRRASKVQSNAFGITVLVVTCIAYFITCSEALVGEIQYYPENVLFVRAIIVL